MFDGFDAVDGGKGSVESKAERPGAPQSLVASAVTISPLLDASVKVDGKDGSASINKPSADNGSESVSSMASGELGKGAVAPCSKCAPGNVVDIGCVSDTDSEGWLSG